MNVLSSNCSSLTFFQKGKNTSHKPYGNLNQVDLIEIIKYLGLYSLEF